ncbi:hypothetical protein ACFFMN_27970 [Planobispora siamensis]|uniref:Uncharacterized protein n=1 Tax=Planobispora siamensis TaxID=936338 RepID=A0A8J3WQ02_9ACTN|nr:hypothetical protein [Planobispora siamensis]GIH97863.1 hypothetical protein Psi01_84930 [Planobispora siamensis]
MSGKARRSMADFLAQQRVVDTSAAATPLETVPPDPQPATAEAPVVPDPYEAVAEGALTERERADLATCEAALDVLRIAFTQAGKALQVIRDARLYRDTHATFEDYVADRWQMSRPQAYRLINAWPLAQRLSPIGDKDLNESQVRELLPLAAKHGAEAAETVYRTVVKTDGVKVTAPLLKGAVSILPPDRFDPAEAAEQIRRYLADGTGRQHSPATGAGDIVSAFTVEVGRLRTALQRLITKDLVSGAAVENPDEVKKAVAELRALLDEVEQKAL